MTKDELLDKVEKIAHDHESKYHGCAQMVLTPFRKILGKKVITDEVFKAASGLCGGVACSGHICGAVSGAMMVIGLFRGREYSNLLEEDKMMASFELGKPLLEKMENEFGSVNCHSIQEKFTGMHYDCWSEEDQKMTVENNLHQVCSKVVGKAGRWTMEILIDEDLVNPEDY